MFTCGWNGAAVRSGSLWDLWNNNVIEDDRQEFLVFPKSAIVDRAGGCRIQKAFTTYSPLDNEGDPNMGRVERGREIARRRNRRVKLQTLRKAYAEAKTESEKADILEKVRKISPFAEVG